MGKRKQIPSSLTINLFQHGNFEGEKGWILGKAQSLPVDVKKILKEKVEEGERLDWKSGRGPKIKSGWTHPGRIIGRVHTLIEDGKSKKEAFAQIAKERNCSPKTVKDIYHKGLRGEYFKGEYRDSITFFEDGVTFLIVPSSGGEIYDPEYVMEKVIEKCGKKEAKRIMLKRIEEAEKFLNKESSSDIEKVYKNILIKHGLIEKAKSLLAQIG